MPERVGVIGSFDVEGFNAGLNTYISGLLRAQSTTESVVAKINSAISNIKPFPTQTANVVTPTADTSSLGNITEQINQAVGVQSNKVSSLIASISSSLSKLSGGEVENALTNLNDLGYTLQQLESFSGGSSKINKFFVDLSASLSTLSKNNDIGTITQTLSTLSFALESFSNLRGVDPTQLTDAIRQLEQVKPIPQKTLDSMLQLAIVLDELAKVPDLANLSRILTTVGRGITGIGDARLIDSNTLGNLLKLGSTLQQFAQIPDVGNATRSITQVASALKTFSKFTDIPTGVFDSLERLSNTLKVISSAGDVGKLGSTISSIARSLNALQQVKAVPTEALNSVTAVIRTVENLSKISGVDAATKNIASLVRSLNNLANVKIPQGNLFSTLSSLTNVLRRLSEITNAGDATGSLSRIISGLSRLGNIKPIPTQVVTSVQNFLNTVTRLATTNSGGLGSLASILQRLTPAVLGYASAANTGAQSTSRLSQALTVGLGTAIGQSAVNLFSNLSNSIKNLFEQAYGLIQFFEGFGLATQNTVAAQLRSADASLSQAEAFALAESKAFGFQKVLTDLAIQSRYTTKQVATAFQTAVRQSFNPDQALRITQILVDYGSALGLPAEKLDLIALALGQINAKGKLAAQEFNQLSEAGLNVGDILQRALGKTPQELQQLREDGIGANVALNAIVNTLESDFAGAAKKTQNTITGLVSSLIDIKELAISRIFTAAFTPVIPILQELVGYLSDDTFLATLQVIGEIIGNKIAGGVAYLREQISTLVASFRALSPETKQTLATFALIAVTTVTVIAAIGGLSLLITALVNPFTVLVATISIFVTGWIRGFDTIQTVTVSALRVVGESFIEIGRAAVEWGSNIVQSLADGIVGSVGIILDALSVVGQAITYLLKPGSPPRLLPDLDIWGTGAADAYLQGWTQANFGALDQFGSLIAKKIRQGVQLGAIAEKDSFQLELIGRQQVAEAIEQIRQFGSVTQDTINDIATTSGFAADVLGKYFAKYAAVAQASDLVASAQYKLNQITADYDAILTPLQQKLDAVNNKEVGAGNADKLIKLNRIVANQTVSEQRRKQALAEIEKIKLEDQIAGIELQKKSDTTLAQQQLTNAQSALESAQKQFDLYKSQVDVQLQTIDILAQQKQFMDSLLKTLGGIGDRIKEALSPLEKQLKIIKLQQDELNDLIEIKRQQAILEDKNSTAAQKTAANLKLQELQIRRNLRALDAKELGVDLTYLENVPIVLADISKKSGGAATDFGDLTSKFEGLKSLDLTGKLDEFNTTLGDVRKGFDDLGQSFNKVIDDIDARLPSFLSIKPAVDGTIPAVNFLTKAFIAFGSVIVAKRIIAALPLLVTTLRILAILARVAIIPALGSLASAFGFLVLPVAGVIAAFFALRLAWDNNWLGFRDVVLQAVDAIKQKLEDLTKFLLQYDVVKNTSLKIVQVLVNTGLLATSKSKEVGKDIGDGIVAGIEESEANTPTLGERLTSVFARLIANMQLFWGIKSPSTLAADEIGKPIGEGLTQGIIDWLTDSVTDVYTKFTDFIKSVFSQETLDTVYALGKDLGKQVTEGIKTIKDGVFDVYLTFTNFLLNVFSKDTFEIVLGYGKSISGKIIEGIKDFSTKVAEITQAVTDFFTSVFSVETLSGIYEQAKGVGKQIIDGIKYAFDNPGEAITGAFTGLIDKLFSAGEEEAEIQSPSKRAKRDIGDQITAGIAEGLTISTILATVTGFISSIIATFVGMAISIVSAVAGLSITLTGTFAAISLSLVTITQTMSDLIDTDYITLHDDTVNETQLMSDDVLVIFSDLQTQAVRVSTLIRDQVIRIFEEMSNGVKAAIRDLKSETLRILGELLEQIQTDFVDKGKDVGEDFLDGIIEGIMDKIEDVQKAAAYAVEQAVKAAKEASESNSPSKRAAREVGVPFSQGISVGIESQVGSLIKSAAKVTNKLFDSVQTQVNNRLAQPKQSSVVNNNSTKVYNLNVSTEQSRGSIQRDFAVMQVLAG